jgi:hypothetical protein
VSSSPCTGCAVIAHGVREGWRPRRAARFALLGLLVAGARFDPDRAVPFAGYAHTGVGKEIQRAIAHQEFLPLCPPIWSDGPWRCAARSTHTPIAWHSPPPHRA